MPISVDLARSHIQKEAARLKSSRQNAVWPKYLFRSCDVRTAIHIVRDGTLKARNNAVGFVDVANKGALQIYEGAHSCARLYFRPKNGFHFRTEGIKCIDDKYRLENQMSIPAMFVFSAESILTMSGSKFSSGNVQKSRVFLGGDRDFLSLDFEAIYHDGPISGDTSYIKNMRMSEVSVDGGVPLDPHLKAIVFRSQSDARTFEHLLEKVKLRLTRKISIERVKGSIFLSRGFFISEINFVEDTLNLRFNFPVDFSPFDRSFKICARQFVNNQLFVYDRKTELRQPSLSINGYQPHEGEWTIFLEDQLAFQVKLRHEASTIF